MKSPGVHLQPFNYTIQTATERDQFHLFTRLPQELRICIWELALQQRERFLHVRIDPIPERGLLGDHGCYTVIVCGRKILSKFFRVSSESRDVAMQFYRLKVPCTYEWNRVRQDGMLHLQPELDMLHVRQGRGESHFVDFLHGLIACDPRHVGLANLALSKQDVYRLEDLEISHLSPEKRMSLARWLAGLQQVWFLSTESAGRMFKGLRSGIPALRRYEMHRSRPILASVPTFQRFARDPRSISRDLRNVFVGTSDPRRMIYYWHKLLERWCLATHVNRNIQYRFMISCCKSISGEPSKIIDRETAGDWLREEDRLWAGWKQAAIRHGHTVETPEQIEEAPQPAIGFWLFPLRSLGELPTHDLDDDARDSFWEGKRVVDMSLNAPELCLSVMR